MTLLKKVRVLFENILVYTGYTLEEIRKGMAGAAGKKSLSYIDVLIDGPYIREQNKPDCVLRGSYNQDIHYLNPACQDAYEAYMKRKQA